MRLALNGLELLALGVLFGAPVWSLTRGGRAFLNHQPATWDSTSWDGDDQ